MKHEMIVRSDIEAELKELLARPLHSLEDLKQRIDDRDNAEARLQNDFAWRYIKQTTHTDNDEYAESYKEFIETIYPQWIQMSDKFGRKFVASDYLDDLPMMYHNLVRDTKHALELYREENVPLLSKQQAIEAEYSKIVGAMSIEYDGTTLTMQEAAQKLKSPDRLVRKEVFERIEARRKADADALDDILTRLVQLRTTIAKNCGFESYTQYAYSSRFDYTQDQIHEFHRSIRDVITPLGQEIFDTRAAKLDIETLKPYDFQAPLFDTRQGNIFSSQDEMLTKLHNVYGTLDPEFAQHMQEMDEQGLLDLVSRGGKASNGYNYPFAKSPYGFIFMNDMLDERAWFTLVHEGGHALHHRLTSQHVKVESLRRTPSELAEIASMAMELFASEDLDALGLSDAHYKSALSNKIANDLLMFSWISKVDLFQERLYDNPDHTVQARHEHWMKLNKEYPASLRTYDTDSWSAEYEEYLATFRQRQMHIFSNPFYYIEYGIAQLASLELYQQYLDDPDRALKNYKTILSSGYTHSIIDTMALGDVEFDLSTASFSSLMTMMMEKYKKLME